MMAKRQRNTSSEELGGYDRSQSGAKSELARESRNDGHERRVPKKDLAELSHLKIAIVCDWLTNVGGAEKVILKIHQLFPDAPIYTSQYRPKGIDWFKDADVRTGWLQHFPVKLRRILGPLRQIYFSRLDLSKYDLVISVTGAEAKAVKAKNGTHISYCHVPTQYYWQMYDEYIKNPGFGVLNPLIRFFFRLLVIPLRHADLHASKAPDYFVTISEYAKDQIKKYYGREATVIHPPVELDDFRIKDKQPPIRLKDDYELKNAYVITSRQVNWKHVDLAVRAAFLSQRHVLIIGEGPEHRKLVKMAKGSDLVQFLPLMDKNKLAKYLNQARGFLFPSLEPFGIAPVEALAAGCPVVAFGEGGAKDYVENGKNGVLFAEQTPISLAEGMLELEKLRLNRKAISKTADAFSLERFDRELVDFVANCEDRDLHQTLLEIAEQKESTDVSNLLDRPQKSKEGDSDSNDLDSNDNARPNNNSDSDENSHSGDNTNSDNNSHPGDKSHVDNNTHSNDNSHKGGNSHYGDNSPSSGVPHDVPDSSEQTKNHSESTDKSHVDSKSESTNQPDTSLQSAPKSDAKNKSSSETKSKTSKNNSKKSAKSEQNKSEKPTKSSKKASHKDKKSPKSSKSKKHRAIKAAQIIEKATAIAKQAHLPRPNHKSSKPQDSSSDQPQPETATSEKSHSKKSSSKPPKSRKSQPKDEKSRNRDSADSKPKIPKSEEPKPQSPESEAPKPQESDPETPKTASPSSEPKKSTKKAEPLVPIPPKVPQKAPDSEASHSETAPRAFPKIGEDVERTRELVKKAEAAKEANRPKFPKIGEPS